MIQITTCGIQFSERPRVPILACYCSQEDLILENYACEYCLGASLMQKERPVAYASNSLSEAKQQYTQIEKEMLAIVYGWEKFYHYTY